MCVKLLMLFFAKSYACLSVKLANQKYLLSVRNVYYVFQRVKIHMYHRLVV